MNSLFHKVLYAISTVFIIHLIASLQSEFHWNSELLYHYLVSGLGIAVVSLFHEQSKLKRKLALHRVGHLQAERKAKYFTNLAFHDSLTGTLNRKGFWQRIADLSETETQMMGLIIIDIDHFKVINDKYGHPMGDAVLCELASLISSNLRQGDIFCRWGGEEFVLVFPCPGGSYEGISQKMYRLVREHHFSELPDKQITVSLGVTTLIVGQDDVNAAIKAADAALYQVKNSGRDNVSYVPLCEIAQILE
jgi:diguanylate cyclase (GGDEF)-like protein